MRLAAYSVAVSFFCWFSIQSQKRNLKLVYGDLFFMVSLGCQLSHNKKDNLDRWLLRIPHTNRSPLLVGNSSTPSHFGSCSSPWLQAVASVLPKATNDGETPSIFSLVEAWHWGRERYFTMFFMLKFAKTWHVWIFGVWQVMDLWLKTWSNLTCGDGEGVIFIEPFKQIYMMKYWWHGLCLFMTWLKWWLGHFASQIVSTSRWRTSPPREV